MLPRCCPTFVRRVLLKPVGYPIEHKRNAIADDPLVLRHLCGLGRGDSLDLIQKCCALQVLGDEPCQHRWRARPEEWTAAQPSWCGNAHFGRKVLIRQMSTLIV